MISAYLSIVHQGVQKLVYRNAHIIVLVQKIKDFVESARTLRWRRGDAYCIRRSTFAPVRVPLRVNGTLPRHDFLNTAVPLHFLPLALRHI